MTTTISTDMSTTVTPLNTDFRVLCDGTRWVLQSFHENDGWRGRACCRTLLDLGRCIAIHVDGEIDPAARAALGLVAPPSEPATVTRKRKPKPSSACSGQPTEAE
jgi:hypothetical protein